MNPEITIEDIRKAVASLRESHVERDFVLRIQPSNMIKAFQLGLNPFCPLTDSNFIDSDITKEDKG